MDLVKTILLYLTMVVSAATGVSPDVTPIPASQVATPAPYVTVTPDPQSLITPAPTAAPTQARYITLIMGDRGTNVRRLQRRLAELGYLDSKDVDGEYGTKTKKAVEQFQKKNGLKADGIAGAATQQMMFDSPAVIYYNSATPTPVPTATPIPYVSVPVYYMDASTNQVLNSSTASCFASTYLYADGTKVPSGYTLVSNSPVQVTVRSGVASPASVIFYYQGPVSSVTLPVYYRDQNGATVAQTSVTLSKSGYVYADSSMLPAGYVFSGQTSAYVSVSGGKASVGMVVFQVARTATATPKATERAKALVTVQYLDAVTGRLLSQNTVSMYSSANVYARDTAVPAGYTRISDRSVYVSVLNGAADPSLVQFYYTNPAVTATPAPAVTVPIYYVEAQTSRILARSSVQLTKSTRVYRTLSLIPAGYEIVGSTYVDVTVSNGTASPGSITFRIQQKATPVPTATVPAYVQVEVRYRYGSTTVYSSNVSCRVGQSRTIYADSSVYGPEYVLSSTTRNPQTVTVSASGVASPSVVTFYLARAATATPVRYVEVPVRFMYGDMIITSGTVSCPVGQTSTVRADSTMFPSEYVLTGSSQLNVTVYSSGIASPSVLIFNLTLRATPTPVPVYYVDVPVRYVYNSTVVATRAASCQVGRTTAVYADASAYGSRYVISGSSVANVYVSAQGVPSPSTVTFYLAARATATPTTPPKRAVKVPIRYMCDGRIVADTSCECLTGETTPVYADRSIYGSDYELSGSNVVYVTVSAKGAVNPSIVVFNLTRKATAVPKRRVEVNVRYMCDGRTVAASIEDCMTGETKAIYADKNLYGNDYVLSGSNVVYVTVSYDGKANPSEVVFSLIRKATAVPQREVKVPVRYMCDGRIVVDATWVCKTNEKTAVYADQRLYGDEYVLSGDSVVYVNVSADGKANPSEVVFNLTRKATPVPQREIKVPVRYVCDGRTVVDAAWVCKTGELTAVYADQRLYGDEYVLSGDSAVYVDVSADGRANPSEVVFNLVRAATPTPVPVLEVEVPVEYVCGSEVVHEYTTVCYSGQDNVVYADEAVYGGVYVLSGPDRQTVRVSASGQASPAMVTFYLEHAVTPAPSFRVDVPVQYICNGRVIREDTARCMNDMKTDVSADTSWFGGRYTLDGPASVSVYVSADGAAQPSTVVFYLNETAGPEPEPVDPDPYDPPSPPHGGGLDTAFPSYQSASLSNPPLLVYLGPGENYYRTKSGVYLNGKAHIFGKDGSWLMIAFKNEDDYYRIGYVRDYKLGKGVSEQSLPQLSYANIPTVLTANADVTEAPETKRKASETLPAGTQVTFLAWLSSGSEWAMIEYVSPGSGQPVRAFVKGNLLQCMQ